MTNRSWKVNNHGFDFRKRKHYFGLQEKEAIFCNFTASRPALGPIIFST
jgi:hypothetical protein